MDSKVTLTDDDRDALSAAAKALREHGEHPLAGRIEALAESAEESAPTWDGVA
jgi:hypothetical protein